MSARTVDPGAATAFAVRIVYLRWLRVAPATSDARSPHPDTRRVVVRLPARPHAHPLRVVDHGQYGIEARILHNEEHYMSHTFAPWHAIPFATTRAAAIHWAEGERKAVKERPSDWY